MPIDPELRRFLGPFVGEVQTLYERCEADVLALEEDAEPGVLRERVTRIARALHTIKGSGATLGLEDVSRLAHRVEAMLAPAKSGAGEVPAGATERILRAFDLIRRRVRAFADGTEDDAGAWDTFERALSGGEETERPSAAEPEPGVHDEVSLRVTTTQVSTLLRDTERLRELRTRLEERRRQVLAAARSLEGGARDPARLQGSLHELARWLLQDAEESGDLLEALEGGLRAISTLPVQSLIDPLQRTFRELCKQLGKEAQLSVVGGEISVDRGVIEALRGPVVHLLRNALDHGIEAPHVRERRGKHRAGTVVVRAAQQGNELVLEIGDDGEGVDVQKVRAAAARQLGDAKVASLNDEEALDLIFLPGLSTREQVTEISGRGVGLDVVRSEVRRLDGRLELKSVPGTGTRFVITVSIGFGSSPVLLVRAGELRVAIPTVAVETLLRVRVEELVGSGASAALRYHDELVPVGDLAAALRARSAIALERGQPMVLVHAGGARRAWIVDEIEGERDLVLRPLPDLLRRVAAYRGVVTTATGELAMVLRPEWLVGDVVAPVSSGRRVLVVDDSLTARAFHRNLLEAGGLIVHTAASGEQAIALAQAARYDAVVCDIGMAPMDGFQLVAALKASASLSAIPVLLVSANDAVDTVERAREVGASRFVSKQDCAAGRLLEEVRSVLRGGA